MGSAKANVSTTVPATLAKASALTMSMPNAESVPGQGREQARAVAGHHGQQPGSFAALEIDGHPRVAAPFGQ